MTGEELRTAKLSKTLTTVLLIGIGIVLIVFLSTSSHVTRPAPAEKSAFVSDDVASSVDYQRLRWRLEGPNSLVTSDINGLRTGFPKLTDKVIQTPQQNIIVFHVLAKYYKK